MISLKLYSCSIKSKQFIQEQLIQLHKQQYRSYTSQTLSIYRNNLLKEQLYYLFCFCVGRMHETFQYLGVCLTRLPLVIPFLQHNVIKECSLKQKRQVNQPLIRRKSYSSSEENCPNSVWEATFIAHSQTLVTGSLQKTLCFRNVLHTQCLYSTCTRAYLSFQCILPLQFWNASILKPLFTITENLPWNLKCVTEKRFKKKKRKKTPNQQPSNNLIPLAVV